MYLNQLFWWYLYVKNINNGYTTGLNNSTNIVVYTNSLQHCVNSRKRPMHFWRRKVQRRQFFVLFYMLIQQKCVFIDVIFPKRNYRFCFYTDFIVMSISNKRQSGISVKRTKWTRSVTAFKKPRRYLFNYNVLRCMFEKNESYVFTSIRVILCHVWINWYFARLSFYLRCHNV